MASLTGSVGLAEERIGRPDDHVRGSRSDLQRARGTGVGLLRCGCGYAPDMKVPAAATDHRLATAVPFATGHQRPVRLLPFRGAPPSASSPALRHTSYSGLSGRRQLIDGTTDDEEAGSPASEPPLEARQVTAAAAQHTMSAGQPKHGRISDRAIGDCDVLCHVFRTTQCPFGPGPAPADGQSRWSGADPFRWGLL
jgi:hypothetical protein